MADPTIDSFTSDVAGLRAELQGLQADLRKLSGGLGGSGGGSMMPNSMAPVSTNMFTRQSGAEDFLGNASSRVAMGLVSKINPALGRGIGKGLEGIGGALVLGGGLTSLMPGMEKFLVRQTGYYQAGLYSGAAGVSRGSLVSETQRLLAGGMTAVGSDATVAAILSGRGVSAGSGLYKNIVGQVSNAAKIMNMSNEVAAQSMEAMTSGSMSANLLSRGIFTSNPMNGQVGNEAQTFEQLARRWMVGSMTTAEIQDEIRRGFLGANISSLGLDPAAEERLKLYLLSKGSDSGFKGVDFKSEDSMVNWMVNAYGEGSKLTTPVEQGGLGFSNAAMRSAYDIVGAETGSVEEFSDEYTQGMELAADALEHMYSTVNRTAQGLGSLNAVLSTLLGNDLGQSILNPVATGFLLGADVANIIGIGAAEALNYATGAGGLGTGQGISPLFADPSGGAGVNAGFGQVLTDSSGQQYEHRGIDYNLNLGDPVYAAYAGTVITAKRTDTSSYGKYVKLEHAGGYFTFYAHLDTIDDRVVEGKGVAKGQLIGTAGYTGNTRPDDNPAGSHLHFELQDSAGNSLNPNSFNPLNPAGSSASTYSSSTISNLGADTPTYSTQVGTSLPIGNNVTINVSLANASQEETMRLVQIVKEQLTTDSMVSAMGAA